LEKGIIDPFHQYTWSSHKGYVSIAKKWNWLYKDFILSLFSKNKAEGIKRYKQFVSKDTLEEINQILGKKKLPSIL